MIQPLKSSIPCLPIRRTAALREGRVSIENAAYFLTLCEARRRSGLSEQAVGEALHRAMDELHRSSDFSLIAGTAMPDHLHLLGSLGSRLSLPRVVGKFKAHTGGALKNQGLQWQENFYEHRLRSGDDLEPYARYIFLNPYRAGIVRLEQRWPYWWRWGEIQFGFEAMLEPDGSVPALWLGDEVPRGVGE